jgi:hypothetical protein
MLPENSNATRREYAQEKLALRWRAGYLVARFRLSSKGMHRNCSILTKLLKQSQVLDSMAMVMAARSFEDATPLRGGVSRSLLQRTTFKNL